jgi:hypothetical protein
LHTINAYRQGTLSFPDMVSMPSTGPHGQQQESHQDKKDGPLEQRRNQLVLERRNQLFVLTPTGPTSDHQIVPLINTALLFSQLGHHDQLDHTILEIGATDTQALWILNHLMDVMHQMHLRDAQQ